MTEELHQVDYDRKEPASGQWERLNFILRRIFSLLGKIEQQVPASSGGGTNDHAALANLSYAASGHTGFAQSVHSHAEADITGLVADLAGKAPTVHTHAEADVTNLVTDLSAKAPYWGFANKTDSTISFAYPTFTVAPVAANFVFYYDSVKYTKTVAQTVDITDTEGMWFFYFNAAGVLVASQTPWNIDQIVSVAYLYWDATNNAVLVFADERHGPVMDRVTHKYLHETIGTRFESGVQVSGNAAGDGDQDVHAELGVTSGYIHDEDIEIHILDDATPTPPYEQVLTVPAQLPVFYRDGASAWRRKTPNNFPVLEGAFFAPARTRCSYNQLSAGSWTQTEVTNSDFFAVWIFATNDINYPIIAILGQRTDTTFTNAQNNNTYVALSFGTLPFQEFKVIARIIFQTANSYANSPKARVREIIDYRTFSLVPTAGIPIATSHASLTGLGSDDHTQYQLRSERSVASGYPELEADVMVPTAQLGTGVADNTSFLRGDKVWSGGAFIGANVVTTYITGSGNWTKAANLLSLTVIMIGGGGGGGGGVEGAAGTARTGGAGGGGGARTIISFSAGQLGDSIAYSVGAGGAGGAGGGVGAAGGPTTFGDFMAGGGGRGHGGSTNTSGGGGGGTAGNGSNGAAGANVWGGAPHGSSTIYTQSLGGEGAEGTYSSNPGCAEWGGGGGGGNSGVTSTKQGGSSQHGAGAGGAGGCIQTDNNAGGGSTPKEGGQSGSYVVGGGGAAGAGGVQGTPGTAGDDGVDGLCGDGGGGGGGSTNSANDGGRGGDGGFPGGGGGGGGAATSGGVGVGGAGGDGGDGMIIFIEHRG